MCYRCGLMSSLLSMRFLQLFSCVCCVFFFILLPSSSLSTRPDPIVIVEALCKTFSFQKWRCRSQQRKERCKVWHIYRLLQCLLLECLPVVIRCFFMIECIEWFFLGEICVFLNPLAEASVDVLSDFIPVNEKAMYLNFKLWRLYYEDNLLSIDVELWLRKSLITRYVTPIHSSCHLLIYLSCNASTNNEHIFHDQWHYIESSLQRNPVWIYSCLKMNLYIRDRIFSDE